jgi:hypothetical protein
MRGLIFALLLASMGLAQTPPPKAAFTPEQKAMILLRYQKAMESVQKYNATLNDIVKQAGFPKLCGNETDSNCTRVNVVYDDERVDVIVVPTQVKPTKPEPSK